MLDQAADIGILVGSELLVRGLPQDRTLVLPLRVNQHIWLHGGWDQVSARFHASVRKRVRKLPELGYSYRTSTDEHDFGVVSKAEAQHAVRIHRATAATRRFLVDNPCITIDAHERLAGRYFVDDGKESLERRYPCQCPGMASVQTCDVNAFLSS